MYAVGQLALSGVRVLEVSAQPRAQYVQERNHLLLSEPLLIGEKWLRPFYAHIEA